MKKREREPSLDPIEIQEKADPPERKRCGNPPATSHRLKGRDRHGSGTTYRNVELRKERHRGERCGVILDDRGEGVLAMLCPFHASKAGKWDELTLQTRASACEDCQRLTVALHQAAIRKNKESEEDEKERDNRE